MRTIIPKTKKTDDTLPPDILLSDTKYPDYKKEKREKIAYEVGDHGQLRFYRTEGFGWCIATLHIANARRNQSANRTYAARISDGAVVRIGNGPHVKARVSIYIRQSRVAALKKYIDLYNAGAESAHIIRDRISTRRAQGALRRGGDSMSWLLRSFGR